MQMELLCIWLLLNLLGCSWSQSGTSTTIARSSTLRGRNSDHCLCMEYWSCVLRGGSPGGYCPPSGESVCCFLPPQGSTSVTEMGLLPIARAKSASCGKKGTDTGKEGNAELGEWPWHVAVLEKKKNLYVCGGSLIDERWLVTAAHCVDEYSKAETLKARLGEYDVLISSKGLPYEEFGVSRRVIHPDYLNTTLVNDIALLQLERPAKKRPHIDIVCLPSAANNTNIGTDAKCVVTGWGRKDENSPHSIVLKEIVLPLWSRDACQSVLSKHFGEDFVLAPTTLCAGSDEKDACDGDGGGPLVCFLEGRWYLTGIVSFGLGCSKPDVPGVYAFVPAFSNWIKSVVRQYS